jgi:hypothetical protein
MVSFVDSIIPDSPSDFGAILIWILVILLFVIVFIDFYTFLSYRKISNKIERPFQKSNAVKSVNKSEEDQEQNIVEVRRKVDKIIETHNL